MNPQGGPPPPLHPLLQRQLRRLGATPGEAPSLAAWQALLERVGRAYAESDQERYLMERSQALASDEMAALNAQLRQARDAAEAMARVKSDFLANMSHEIRTPLNAIIGMGHLVQRTALDARQREYVDSIARAGHHLLGLINDVLDLSKIEAGMMTVERAPFRFESLMSQLANLMGERAAEKGLELVFDVPRDVPAVLVGDELRLGQVLVNYVSNAIKFTERGEVVVSVRVAERGPDDALLRFSVRDTGIGLTGAQLGRLFRSFEQADASTTRRFGGTGLGLSIARRLAGLMGGEVGADSVPGEGSTFWFTARVGLGRAEAPMVQPTVCTAGRRVLVVDDNVHARFALNELLAGMGFDAVQVDSGEAALAEIARAHEADRPFDVALVDWQMPGLSGVDTALRVREAGLERPPAMVLVTAHDRERALAQARDVGLDDVLTKPVSPSTLYDRLTGLLCGPGRGPDEPVVQRREAPPGLAARRGARVLLAEDHPVNQRVVVDLLTDAGLSVTVAENGRIAVERAAEGGWDLVLMDMQMPEMDGLQATRAIRELAGVGAVPIVAMTANAMAQDRERCLAAGMVDFLGKPFDPDDLFALLVRWIPSRHDDAPAAAAATDAGTVEAPSERAPAAAPATPDGTAATLAGISGLDAAAALRRVRGRVDRYEAMLREFVANQADAAVRIGAAIGAGDAAGAERLAHTLKGLAGNIGAQSLQATATALEHALRAGEADWPSRLEAMRRSLDAQVRAIVDALPPLATGVADRADDGFDPAAFDAACERLEALLACDDGDAEQVAREHEALLRAGLADRFDAFFAAVCGFDFGHAAALLADARRGGGDDGCRASDAARGAVPHADAP